MKEEKEAPRSRASEGGGPSARLLRQYARVRDGTTAPDQVLLLVLDGASRFVREARVHMERGEHEKKHNLLLRVQSIVLELGNALDKSIGETTYRNLQGLYFFIYRKLSEANVRNDVECLQEGLDVLHEVEDLWRQAVGAYRTTLKKTSTPAAGSSHDEESTESERQGLCVEC